jgi:hypothetical protein
VIRRKGISVAALALSLGGCEHHHPVAASPSAPVLVGALPLEERIAREVIAASPPSDPGDAAARDAAGERLVKLQDLLDAAGDRILWGGFNPEKGYEPKANQLTELSPVVWVKLYLSTFSFAGTYSVRQEGGFTVVELPARFRDRLDSGDYPYPFWHSAKKWNAYVNTRALFFVFDRGKLVAAYRAPPPDSAGAEPRTWDARWRWLDDAGHERPRVALFSYLFSPGNPAIDELDRTYRKLDAAFRGNNCVSCHAPDNSAKASVLLLLDFPNQALVARHSLVEILRGNKMPPADPRAGRPAGLGSEELREQLLALAEQFEREADAALSYEKAQ